ncbi:hypothetical protein QBC43DRAFT_337549 [Cladorrhinum sp. PSN259]|nr:hypothetical protein QBC43DRAFT_337549 [Cladorrhinum sp. PSN259]
MKFTIITALLSATALANPLSARAPRAKFTGEAPQITGQGCPAGTVNVAYSNDNEVVTARFTRFTAAVSPAAPGAPREVDCSLTFRVRQPVGFRGVTASINSTGTWFSGGGATGFIWRNHVFPNPTGRTTFENSISTVGGPTPWTYIDRVVNTNTQTVEQIVEYKFEGRLRIQASTGAVAVLDQNFYRLDITNQLP